MSATKGEKIVRYQDLYKKYSRLGLSKSYDRPIAIDGIQNRLLEAFKTRGGFGVFDDGVSRGLLRRGLLWHRGFDEGKLSRIEFPSDRATEVPSWSWMAYTGGIDYLELEFDGVDWEDLQSPWTGQGGLAARTMDRGGNIALGATVRDFDLGKASEGEGVLIFDTPGSSEKLELQCVVLGRQKGDQVWSEKTHYLLVVTPTTSNRHGTKIYKRVGAGYLPGRCIAAKGLTANIH